MRLVDADVIIWNWRGQEDAALLLADSPFAVSAVTYMELVQGMRNRREFAKLRADLKLWQVRLLPVTELISARDCGWCRIAVGCSYSCAYNETGIGRRHGAKHRKVRR